MASAAAVGDSASLELVVVLAGVVALLPSSLLHAMSDVVIATPIASVRIPPIRMSLSFRGGSLPRRGDVPAERAPGSIC